MLCCMRCPHLHRVRICRLHGPPSLPCVDPWEPGNRDHPTIFCMFCTSTLSFAPTSRRVVRSSECCRGTIFVVIAVAPFSFRHGDKCFITCSCQHFHKNCIKLVYVIRIMLTTFKCLKLLLALKLLNDLWGFYGIVVCYFRPHLNLPNYVVSLCFTPCHV